jgi:hypothetical protein
MRQMKEETNKQTKKVSCLTAMAGGSPPVLLQGAISAPTKTTFMPPVAAARTTREGSLRPPGRCVLRAGPHGERVRRGGPSGGTRIGRRWRAWW